ncbi:MAG: bifunctional glutamate N-acetyltransferase/amino-acid acetyltransferase ArgJ [Lachnospiraceae bacterium]|nr:bifunctional glutamate N-acetyltransferase/amino-acid acetyltransferase ArgJ [Candidatus Equihabitans merdae]
MEGIDMIEVIKGGVTAAKGFYAGSTEANIKYKNRTDMAMIVSDVPCAIAGTFTSNVVKAACVQYDKKIVTESKCGQAVVINSGIANACTGKEGFNICEETAKAAAGILNDVALRGEELKGMTDGIAPENILVASTGVIGMQIPLDRIVAGTKKLAGLVKGSIEAGHDAACAIMTTDTVPKEACCKMTFSDGTEAYIGGMCKGAGMIHPNMCTMLAFVTTDAAIDQALLQEALKEDIKTTYNMVSVDGDTSTNDTCLVLANGLAGNKKIEVKDADYAVFVEALHYVNESLAKQMAADGEGATMMFECKVVNASDELSARKLARSVVGSNLTKCAIFGKDANWGRILCALGYSGAQFDPEVVDITICGTNDQLVIVKDGVATDYSEDKASEILGDRNLTLLCDMKCGDAEAAAWGCDLTYDYVKINGDYRS